MAGDEGTHPTYGFEVLIEDERLGIIKGHVEYPGRPFYHNIWEVCSRLTVAPTASSNGSWCRASAP